MLQHLLGWLGPPASRQDCGKKGKAQSPESVMGRRRGGNYTALTVVAVAVSWYRRSLASPQEAVRGSQKTNEEQLLPQKWPQALEEPGEEQICWHKGSSVVGLLGAARRPHKVS